MDYAIEIQRIIDALKEDKETHPLWRNKISARLTELQPWCLMLYEPPSFSGDMPYPVQNDDGSMSTVIPGQPQPGSLDISQIPESLREFADPNKLQPPEQPTV